MEIHAFSTVTFKNQRMKFAKMKTKLPSDNLLSDSDSELVKEAQ